MKSFLQKFGKYSGSQVSSVSSERGAALLITLFIFFSVSVGVLLSSSTAVLSELRLYRSLASSKFAYLAAESGLEDAVYRQIQGKQLSANEVIRLNGATSTLTTNTISADEIQYTITGDSGDRYRKIFTGLKRTSSRPFQYAAQVGEGGISIGINSGVNGTGLAKGHVYSNGAVIGSSGVTITGDISVASHIVPDQFASSTSCATDEVLGKVSPNIDYAQQFEPATTDSLAVVTLYMKRVGAPTGGTIRIVPDYLGQPATTTLAFQPLPYSLVSTNYGWVDVIFTAPANVVVGTKYWIVFDSTVNATKYWTWCRSTASTYASGTPAYKIDYSTSGAWTAVAGDLAFKTSYGFGVSKLDTVTALGTVKADTIANSSISGSAYYQTISGSTVSGTSYPSSPTPPKIGLPISTTTIQTWKTEATAGGTTSGNQTYAGGATVNLGPRKISGNVTVNDNSKLIVNGTLYITGKLDVEDNGWIQCAAGYAADSCIVVVDGNITIQNNGHTAGSGNAASYIMLLTTIANCNGVGSSGTGCASGTSGIYLADNVDSALFYTGSSMVNVFDNVTVTSVVAYKLMLNSNAYVVYDDKLSMLHFSTGMSTPGPWYITNWREIP